MKAESRFSVEACRIIKREIDEYEGRELLFVGRIGADDSVDEVALKARGTADSVPAMLPHAEQGDVIIHNHPSGNLEPSEADLRVASFLGNQGIGFFIIDNSVETVNPVAEPLERKTKKQIDSFRLVKMISTGGGLSRVLTDFEPRDSQMLMLEAVAEVINGKGICVAEAGTGVGKSLAYLLPAADWAVSNGERMVIATATINLQNQLLEKDIPVVRKLLDKKISAVIVKGRSNYICLRRFHEEYANISFFPEEEREIAAIAGWVNKTETGSREDLPFMPNPEVWNRICSEADSCLGIRCRVREGCFVLHARRRAASADLLVVNHHILFSDLAIRLDGPGFDVSALLPPFKRLIIDEAHNVERNATSFFSREISQYTVQKQVTRILRERHGKLFGLLKNIGPPADTLDTAKIFEIIGEINENSIRLNENALQLCGAGSTLRLTASLQGENEDAVRALVLSINALIESIKPVFLNFEQENEPESVFELRIVFNRLRRIGEFIRGFLDMQDQEDSVFWIERRRNAKGTAYGVWIQTPVFVRGIFGETLFKHFDTIVFTSATLTVRKSFDYWNDRIGLDLVEPEKVRTHIFPSPFDYRTNVILSVPTDIPIPVESGYTKSITEVIPKIISITGGHALVLFTSYDLLQKTYLALREWFIERGYPLLRQGEDDRTRLLNKFRESESSVLFATDSFWEGIDVPGRALQLVIITRLPFRVPDDPVHQARMEAVEKHNGNPFMALALPEAVMKFKQGFGRLIRKKEDYGAVVVLDSRIISKFYGRFFLGSLPPVTENLAPVTQMLENIGKFYLER